jgi:hypothetical protein
MNKIVCWLTEQICETETCTKYPKYLYQWRSSLVHHYTHSHLIFIAYAAHIFVNHELPNMKPTKLSFYKLGHIISRLSFWMVTIYK